MFRTSNYIQKIQTLSKLNKNTFNKKQLQLCNQAQEFLEGKRSLDFETYRFMKTSYEDEKILKSYETDFITKLFDKKELNDDDYCFIVLNDLNKDAYFKHEVEKYLDKIHERLRCLETVKTERMFLDYHKE